MEQKILMVGTYPIENPQHGGQIRVAAIKKMYEQAGLDVHYCSFVGKTWYADLGSNDIEVNVAYDDAVKNLFPDVWLHSRITVWEKKRFEAIFDKINPAIVQLEQPYLYPWIKLFLKHKSWTGRIIYSSQNVESQLKDEFAKSDEMSHIPAKAKLSTINKVRKCEDDLIKDADMVVACTEADADVFRLKGAIKVVVARNAIEKRPVDLQNLAMWQKYFTENEISKIILYIGSAHPPNINGFFELIGYRLGFLPRDSQLVILGGVGKAIVDKLIDMPEHIRVGFSLRCFVAGLVEDNDIASLLELATVIIIPVKEGGGSNLKTAEALLSGRRIIATDKAFRSYEDYKHLPEVAIANTADEFRREMLKAIKLHPYKSGATNKEELTWKHTLYTLASEVRGMA